MKLKKIREILKAEIIYGNELLEKEVKIGCAADLMSDVLAFGMPDSLLLTGLTNTQVVRTAEMIDVAAICFVRGKIPQKEIIELAQKKEIPILSTKFSMFQACGELNKEGLPGEIEK